MKRALAMLLVAGAAVLVAQRAPDPAAPAHAVAYGSLPLAFERNDGQAPARFDFLARSASGMAGLSSRGATVARRGKRPGKLMLVGAARSRPHALERLPGKVNHLVGDDPAGWRTDIPTFARVRYPEVWPGIDVEWHGNQRRLEYDLVIAAGADRRGSPCARPGGCARATRRRTRSSAASAAACASRSSETGARSAFGSAAMTARASW